MRIPILDGSLSLSNALDYYIIASTFELKSVKSKAASMLSSRFHSDTISAENTLSIAPNILENLVSDKCFQHCTVFQILQFLFKWVARGKLKIIGQQLSQC